MQGDWYSQIVKNQTKKKKLMEMVKINLQQTFFFAKYTIAQINVFFPKYLSKVPAKLS